MWVQLILKPHYICCCWQTYRYVHNLFQLWAKFLSKADHLYLDSEVSPLDVDLITLFISSLLLSLCQARYWPHNGMTVCVLRALTRLKLNYHNSEWRTEKGNRGPFQEPGNQREWGREHLLILDTSANIFENCNKNST